jgi:hypothetical protein
MLTEAHRIALDQREYRQDIDRHVKWMQAQPVHFSAVRNGKLLAEINLASLRRQLELATAEERPHVEEEIAECLAQLERCTAELTERGDEVNEPQDLPREPPAADEISETLVKPEARSAIRSAARVLHRHRLRILKDRRRHLQLDSMDHLANCLAISKSQMYGMARGDTSRYGDDTLNLVLQKLDCSHERWDIPSPLNRP